MVVQGYEDIIKHKADREINSKKVRTIRDGRFTTIRWEQIRCGDIVEVPIDNEFPCDLVLLYAKTDTGTCFIQTSNLDGETNLKVSLLVHLQMKSLIILIKFVLNRLDTFQTSFRISQTNKNQLNCAAIFHAKSPTNVYTNSKEKLWWTAFNSKPLSLMFQFPQSSFTIYNYI